ncbi:MAG: kelch repeat-containing protein, partial [Candidatus Thermoplasmatota archaeon]
MRKKILIIESIIFFFVFLELISPTALVHGGSSWSQTSDIDFNGNGAYFTNVTIVGTGIDAQIELAKTDGDWKQKSPPYKPSARCFRAMATIHNDDKVLLFGGFNGTALDDTWVYDLSENEWVERAIFCLTKPSARYWHAMAGIYNDNKVVLFGGYPLLDDTWVYDLSDDSWEQKFPSNKPSARDVHVMATIYNDDKVLLFGGYNETTSTSLGDTWVYDLSDNQWYNKTPSNSPSARSGHAMATIYNDDKVVLFGGTGVGAGAGIKDDTWIYDLGDNNWVEKSQTTKPTPRISHQMATIHNDDKVLLFGGYDGTTRKNDTWVYDLRNENWTRKLPSNKPSARFGSEMAGIYNEDKVVLFGGNDSALKDDTWLYELVVYPSSGEFLSPYKDLGGKSNFLSITWNATIQTGTSLKFQIRTAATQSNLSSKNFVGPDGVTDTYYTKSGTKIWSGHNGDSFLQYKIYFNTTDTDQTPVLKDVKIMYNILPDPP